MINIDFNEYFRKENKFSGNVLLAKNNEIIFNESYGYSNKEMGIKNTLQTKFMIGSMTKTITALCIMQLSEKGMLSTQQNIEDFFPGFHKGCGIKIHHLLTHTSGLANYNLGELHTPQEILQIAKDSKLKFAVGRKWSYSNTNYLILGLIIEKVSGIGYHQYVKHNIFMPAQMNNSGFSDDNPENIARNYINGKKGFYMNPSMFFAAGDVISTIGDLYLLDRAIQHGKLLSPHTLNEMQKVHYNGKYIKYGYGLFVHNHFGCKSICHCGSIPIGYASHFERYINDDITIIVLSNDLVNYQFLSLKGAGGTYISREIASLIYGKKLSVLKKII